VSDLKQKPFDIDKRLVWEAYRKVAANKGAAGVDGQSIAEFEEDLKGNLYYAMDCYRILSVNEMAEHLAGRCGQPQSQAGKSSSVDARDCAWCYAAAVDADAEACAAAGWACWARNARGPGVGSGVQPACSSLVQVPSP
jgi:hypothetical protein